MRVYSLALLILAGALAACGSAPPGNPTLDTAPTVTSTTPANASTVGAGSTVSIVFSKPMNTSSVVVAASDGTNPYVLGTGTWSNGNATVTFAAPPAALGYGKTYSLSIDGKDVAGSALSTAYLTFSVEPQPAVTAESPSGASVPVTDNASLQFNVAMDHSSVENAFSLEAGSTPVVCLFSWSADSTIVSCTPNAPFTQTTTYTLALASTAKSALGDPVATSLLPATFTTGVHDTTPPTVTGRDTTSDVGTVGGIGDVATNAAVTIVFSKAVNQASAQGAFSLAPPGGAAGQFSWDVTGSRMTFQPTSPLAHGATETWTVVSGVLDLSGNALAATATGTFHVVAEATEEPALVAGESGYVYAPSAYADETAAFVGVDASNNVFPTFLTFDLTSLSHVPTDLVSGQLSLAVLAGAGSPATTLGTLYAQSVNYGATLLGTDATLSPDSHICIIRLGLGAHADLIIPRCAYESAFPSWTVGTTVSTDVTSVLQYQWSDRANRGSCPSGRVLCAQFKIEPSPINNSTYNYYEIGGATASAGNLPVLSVTYEYPW